MIDHPETTEEEEASIELLMPWHCYSDNLKNHRQYKSLSALCETEGVNETDVTSAIKNNKGNFGSFHFVNRALSK